MKNHQIESELYLELGELTKKKDEWEASIPYVLLLLDSASVKIRAKALWLLGEMGLTYPASIKAHVPVIASFFDSTEPLLSDEEANVRLSFIWASENIATNTPDPYEKHMPVFAALLHDPDDRVRMEAPEMFRVLGKRRPQFAKPYLEELRALSETDENRVVRIHCLGALKATNSASSSILLQENMQKS